MTRRCPTLEQLPQPPVGRTGWPWTEESEQLPDTMPDGSPWPRISIVTPSYNQGQFIEETIRSVLLQGYPDLEYIIIDGGSTDNSVEIIKRYEPWLAYWVSEPDGGQSHAINKALERTTGQVFNWINSDDLLEPGALEEIGRLWALRLVDLIAGRGLVIEEGSLRVLGDWAPCPPREPADFLKPQRVVLCQPSTFLALYAVQEGGGLRTDLHYIFDWELYFRLTHTRDGRLECATTPRLLARHRRHSESKTAQHWSEFRAEWRRVLVEFEPRLSLRDRLRARRQIRTMDVQDAVSAASAAGEPLVHLACLPARYPSVLGCRFFWGAVRRCLW